MINLKIDGRAFEAEEGQTVLQVARAAGIEIPALCHHAAVAPYGACRLCLVEVTAAGRTRIVTSCSYPVRDGLEVRTDTERVLRIRRLMMELLLARAPESEPIQKLAASMGVTEQRLPTVTHAQRDCILCGLCVNVCRDIIGAAAISFAGRGVNRAVAAPFLQPSDACIGCGACAAVCPVGTIKLRWHEDTVEVSPFKSRVPLLRCEECHEPIISVPFGDQLKEKLGDKLPEDATRLCHLCKRKKAAKIAVKMAMLTE